MDMRIIFGIIAVCLLVISGIGFMTKIENSYGSTIDPKANGFSNRTKNLLNQTTTQADETYNKLYKNETISPNAVTVTYAVVSVGVGSVKTMWLYIKIFSSLIGDTFNSLTESLGMNEELSYVLGAITAVIAAAVLIWFISILLRWYVGGS